MLKDVTGVQPITEAGVDDAGTDVSGEIAVFPGAHDAAEIVITGDVAGPAEVSDRHPFLEGVNGGLPLRHALLAVAFQAAAVIEFPGHEIFRGFHRKAKADDLVFDTESAGVGLAIAGTLGLEAPDLWHSSLFV
jgi:hypothetical protein